MQEAWEFRYDESGRQRYYARRWTPDEQHPTDPRYFVADPTMEWTDYLGAQQTVDGQGDPTVYLHGDMVRSTMLTTDEVGAPVTSQAYTAFGEPVTYDAGSQTWRVGFPAAGGMGGSPVTRYQYAGGFGYESGLITLQGVNPALPPVTLQHVGERWYDPALGRFVQRDPIGLGGGVNVYVHCENNPLDQVDPSGLSRGGRFHDQDLIQRLEKLIARFLARIASEPQGYKEFWRKALRTANRARNSAYSRLYGPWASFIAVCVISAELGAAAARASEPYTQRGSEGYSGWTQGGRAGLNPWELLDLPEGDNLNPWNDRPVWR